MTKYQDILQEAINDLPSLMKNPDAWNSKLVDYESPVVERLWIPYKDCRLSLHKIHPCEKPLKHVHPWPAAVRVISGKYEMETGIVREIEFSDDWNYILHSSFIMSAGSEYDLISSDLWHSVKPIGSHSISVMVMGQPWVPHQSMRSQPKPGELKSLPSSNIINIFKEVDYSLNRTLL